MVVTISDYDECVMFISTSCSLHYSIMWLSWYFSITVRGHCMYWDVDQFVSEWLKPMTGPQVEVEMQRRIDYMLPRYNNE